MPRPSDVEALKQLALLGALADDIEVSSGEFASLIDASQQTSSRRLIELTDAGYLQRNLGVRRQRIRITDEGESVLRAEHLLYQRLFEQRDRIVVHGTVASGLGEGKYYLSRPGYNVQFEEHLGWTPYPGTLNLKLSGPEANKLKLLRRAQVHAIERFEAEGRTFGGATSQPALLGDQPCATVLPNRTHHAATLELIAPVCLRDALPCKDGDELDVTVFLQEPA
ncbi:MAG: DUF120 domain-containing protein [Thermoplasmatota archaeon]